MKKMIAALLCLTVLTGCFPDSSGVVHTGAKEAVAAFESKDDMILVVGKSTCGACEEFKKVLDEMVNNYDLRITEVYMDDDPTVDEETGATTYPEYEELEQYIGVVGGTPTVYFIQEGAIKGVFTGSVSYDTFKSKVEKYGFLKEKEDE